MEMGDDKGKEKEATSLQPEDYAVGWICAIPKELTAARAMLDSVHSPLEAQPKHDENNYILGSIGKHNVAIACLPEYGVVSAAVAAKSMQTTFPRLRFGLMVGIGGGIPNDENDIRLGDIVVSLPTGQHGGVIQYDLGKMEVDGFRRLGTLNKPPTLLRTAVASLRSTRGLGNEISRLVNGAFEHDEDADQEWTYPGSTRDILFKPTFNHIEKSRTCDPCVKNTAEIMEWETRKSTNPRIFYGNIASGNSVMKNGLERDSLAERDNVICLEMEAAGLMDNFPCLVIRGICDYADSHKNEKWQPYAAAVAAAYTKKLLSLISLEAVAALDSIRKNFHWIVPRQVNPFFTGRKDILVTLRTQLCEIQIESQKRFIIYGMGGSGKSEVCLKFADTNRESFWGIFWVDAGNDKTIKDGITDAAKRACKVKDMSYEDSKLWFSSLEKSWLLIFDNADDTAIDYSEFFPSGSRGSILLTTRNKDCSIHSTVGSCEFDNLLFDGAVILLLKSAGFEKKLWPEKSALAQILVKDEVLAQHALAITQAGAFIRQGLCKLEEYGAIFERERKRLLTHCQKQAKSIYGSVYATFEVSVNAMKESSSPELVDALKLLEVLAFLYREGVPEQMFIKAWNFALKVVTEDDEDVRMPSLWHVNRLRKVLHENTTPGELDHVALRKARQVLRSFSLITINPETDDVSMHPLVHAWAKDRLHSDLQVSAWATTASILLLSIDELNYQDFFIKIVVHIGFCCSLLPHDVFVVNEYPPLEISRIFYRFIWVIFTLCDGKYDRKWVDILEILLLLIRFEIRPQSWNWRHLEYLVAMCHGYSRKYERQMQSLKDIIWFDRENNLGPENPDHLRARRELGVVYGRLGQTREAAKLLKDVVRIQQTVLTSMNPDLLDSQYELALVYLRSDQPGKAVELLREMVRIQQEITDPKYSFVNAQRMLALAYIKNNQPEKAIELLHEALREQQKQRDLWDLERLLAVAYERNGQPEKPLGCYNM